MNTDSFFYSETLDELYREKEAIASTYNSLADYCAHLKAIEDSMMARGLSFCNAVRKTKRKSERVNASLHRCTQVAEVTASS